MLPDYHSKLTQISRDNLIKPTDNSNKKENPATRKTTAKPETGSSYTHALPQRKTRNKPA
jgi:hypothetical protein